MSTNTESIAAAAVRDSLLLTGGILSPDIKERDKTPSWDGEVFVYEDDSEMKSKMTGKVQVQIKGHKVDFKNYAIAKNISEPVEISDLRNYLNDGGVIFFVVQINKDNISERKIYYVTLTPVKLKQYLLHKRTGGKTPKIPISLTEFPVENNKKISIFVNFHRDHKRQTSFANTAILSIQDIKNLSAIEEYSMSVMGYGYSFNDENLLLKVLSENETYLYAKIKGSSILHPIDFIPDSFIFAINEESNVSVGGKVFYNQVKRIEKLNCVTIQIGDSFTLNFETDTTPKIKYTESNYLRKRIMDLEFFLSTLNNKGFYLGDNEVSIIINEVDLNNLNISEHIKRLEYYQKILNLFEKLHIEKDIDLSTLSENDYHNLNVLIEAIVDNQNVKGLSVESDCIFDFKIADITMRVVIKKDSDGYRINDFFDFTNIAFLEYESGKIGKSSLCSVLSVKDYSKLSNIYYSKILSSYKSLEGMNGFSYEQVNSDLLKMILAYDDNNNIRLLEVAEEIAIWLLQATNGLANEINTINYYQILKRKGELSREHKYNLQLLTENPNSPEEIKVAAYLLLDNQLAAEIHFELMSKNVKDDFVLYPIYRFWQPGDNN